MLKIKGFKNLVAMSLYEPEGGGGCEEIGPTKSFVRNTKSVDSKSRGDIRNSIGEIG
jgi:hypothetical protein